MIARAWCITKALTSSHKQDNDGSPGHTACTPLAWPTVLLPQAGLGLDGSRPPRLQATQAAGLGVGVGLGAWPPRGRHKGPRRGRCHVPRTRLQRAAVADVTARARVAGVPRVGGRQVARARQPPPLPRDVASAPTFRGVEEGRASHLPCRSW